MDDAAIIELYWMRSESAISETAKKYGAYCRKIALNILGNPEDSEECVNDAYLKTWDAIPPQRPVVFPSFLGRITRNISLNRYKARKTVKRGGGEVGLLLSELEECIPSAGDVESEYEAGRIAAAIDDFLYSAGRDNRLVFVRRYWFADSISAISERYGLSESNVKTMLFRTRGKLREHLEKEGISI